MEVAPEGMFCPKNLQWSSYITKWQCTPELSKMTEATKFFLFVWWNVVKLSDLLEPSFNFCTAVSLEEKKIAFLKSFICDLDLLPLTLLGLNS